MIQAGTCISYLVECQNGVHAADDVYMAALYSPQADLGPETTRYVSAGEVVGDGYVAGGKALTGRVCKALADGSGSYLTFADPTWDTSSISARGVLIYNKSKGGRAVMIGDFGRDFTSSNAPFVAHLPPEGCVIIKAAQ